MTQSAEPHRIARVNAVPLRVPIDSGEPLIQNDVLLMADMRRRSDMAIRAGQSEGLSFRYRGSVVAHS